MSIEEKTPYMVEW